MTNDETKKVTNFKTERIKKLEKLYTTEIDRRRGRDETPSYSASTYANAAAVRTALRNAATNRDPIIETSKLLYATNPIYANIIDYLSNMYAWRYKVVPHKIFTKSKAKLNKKLSAEDYALMYNQMLEVVDGLSIETKFPTMLNLLYIQGAIYFTTYCDEESITIDTILLPDKYCRKVGETQFGTAIIEFDFSYFTTIGLRDQELNEFFKSFPKEFKTKYNKYLGNNSLRWQQLDSHYSSALMLNEIGLPTYFYLLGSILDYEKYQDNELQRNENLLKYLVVHTIPHYNDNLIFEVDEVAAIHKSLKKIIETNNDNVRVITSWGDVHVDHVSENDTSENEVLSKAFKSIFNNAGFNSGLFTSDSVTALKMSLIRDKGLVWRHVQVLLNFYNVAINNWFDFKGYQADIDILPISFYTYDDDVEQYKNNATLGVGKLDYIIAAGVKQKNIQDTFELENFLNLDQITPMQTSYTQTAQDRAATDEEDSNNQTGTNSTNKQVKTEEAKESISSTSGIEPSERNEETTNESSADVNVN